MQNLDTTVVALEKKFWQSLVDHETDVALSLLCEPALMVSAHGAMKFDHAAYRQMAEHGTMVLESFEFSDMQVVFPNDATAVLSYRAKQRVGSRAQGQTSEQLMHDTSTWVRSGDGWLCVLHTETPAQAH